ncbi:hypothetical protein GXW82_44565 [Streptacidiphilus sp. 4-A2]|nr:hypothetical protein [Streptacidiphilus sp. 4-A2]
MTNEYERREAALERIQDRYRTPREREDQEQFGGSRRMPVHEALMRVNSVADARDGEHPYHYAPADPDGEDLLAALALVAEAREQLERIELRLIRQARTREITWTDIAVPLGLRTRSPPSRGRCAWSAPTSPRTAAVTWAGCAPPRPGSGTCSSGPPTPRRGCAPPPRRWSTAPRHGRRPTCATGWRSTATSRSWPRAWSPVPGAGPVSGIEAVAFHLLPHDRHAPSRPAPGDGGGRRRPRGGAAAAAGRNARGFRW